MSQYVSSVPLLTRQWLVAGYIWQCATPLEHLPDGSQFVAVLPDGRTLIATARPLAPAVPGHHFSPWSVEIYSDAQQQVPLAVLDNLGQYAQIESFSIPLEDDVPPSSAPDAKSLSPDSTDTPTPALCRFLCGQTTGQLHLCPE
jgi:hypothetical protein